MSEKAKEKPELSPAGRQAATARQERLAVALRANLGRRKTQARERAAPSDGSNGEPPPPQPSPSRREG